ncbi:polysaccharide deacetylase family protein [Autumnicola musiva]|uniref:Polysaccharide deacetylase family protein n=1 Tax=Autumnicola musiva TaxID=3075589 RepID=A0ABU3D7G5_9FLAO|nr:polysaccharide deacetylase family protein [Zunongwangia sp. F117]MDT0677470.1 polysaccharide deacetylase family protein [Zunongwangia sp. F117]
MKNNHGHLVISLDFELLWGVFDVVNYKQKRNYFENTHLVIPKILEEFKSYEVNATWAVVGMLFNRNWNEWEQNIPERIPGYLKKELSPYKFGEAIKFEGEESQCFASELINWINNTPGQEIGSHTYSHYYCTEKGQTVEDFRADLEKAVNVAKEHNYILESLVFPRNQINKAYLQVCSDCGIKTVRSNPDSWYWKNPASESLLNKIFRTGDAYNPLAPRKSYSITELQKEPGMPLLQKASRFLRPVENNSYLHNLKINRIKAEMSAAAKNKEVYHLWWHPHNFGERPEESMKDLNEILIHYQKCKQKYDFKSVNMKELDQIFNSG